MAKAMEDGLSQDLHEATPSSGEPISDLISTEEVGGKMKRKLESAYSLEPTTNDLSDHVDHGLKRRKLEEEVPGSSMKKPDDYYKEVDKIIKDMVSKDLHEQEQCTGGVISKPMDTVEISNQTKRKRESTSSLVPSTEDLSDHIDRDLKRRKLETGTEFFQVSPSSLPEKTTGEERGELEPDDLFCRSSSLAAVFEAVVDVGALEPPQAGNSNASDLDALDAIDLELLGEGHDDSEQKQTQSSVDEDLKIT